MKKRLLLFAAILIIVGCLVLGACAEGVSPVSEIVVSTLPVISYYRGDSFDFNNAAITAYYENGKTETVTLEPSMISDFESNKVGEQILTVKYGGAMTYIKVTVSEAPVYSVEVEDGNYKKTYVEGQSLNLNDMFLKVVYVNGYTESVPVTADMVSGFDTERVGLRQIVVTYLGKTALVEIEVVSRSISSIGIEKPSKTNYVVGQALDFTDGRLFIAYNNNYSEYKDIIGADGKFFDEENFHVEIDGEETNVCKRAGTMVYVTVVYYGHKAEFFITVEDVKAVKLELEGNIKDQPRNSAAADLSEGKLNVTYNNGDFKTFNLDDERVEVEWRNFDITRNGEYEIAIRCEGILITAYVKVVEPTSAELQIDTMGKIYYRDGADIDVTEWKYRVLMTNGKYREFDTQGSTVAYVNMDMLTDGADFGTSEAGIRYFEFTYTSSDGKSVKTVVEVEVFEKYISGIVSFTAPDRKVYRVGESLDLSESRAEVAFNDGSSKKIAVTADMLSIAEGESYTSSAGKQTVILKYTDSKYPGEAEFTYEITVVKVAEYISAGIDEVKTQYILGESFDSNGLVIFIGYEDKTADNVTDFSGEEWIIEGAEYDRVGETHTRIYYGHKSHGIYCDIPITVTNSVVNVAFADGFTDFGEVTEGMNISIGAEAKIVVTRQNGEIETVDIVADMIDYDRFDYTLGRRKVKVTYSEGIVIESYVTVVTRKITLVSVKNLPEKTDYVVGADRLSLDGLKISVIYNNGMELGLTGEDFVYSGDNQDKAEYIMPAGFARNVIIAFSKLDTRLQDGAVYKTQTIIAEVTDVPSATTGIDEFTVYCFKDIVTEISVDLGNGLDKLEVFEREDLVFPDNATVTVKYESRVADTLYINALLEEDYSLDGFDKYEAGDVSVKFRYLRKECSFMVTVKSKILSDMTAAPAVVTVKEGMNISPDNIVVSIHYLRNDGTEYSPEYRPIISFNNVECTFDPSKIVFTDSGTEEISGEYELSYTYGNTTVSCPITVIVSRKKAVRLTMQEYPQDVYVENEARGLPTSDNYEIVNQTVLNLSGGYVMVSYDNGTSERIALDSNRLIVNSSEFDSSEINDDATRQARIYVRFQDETGTLVEVSFYVSIRDRHYLRADYGLTSGNVRYSYVYGTGKDARPDFTVYGRRVFGGNETELINNSTFDSTFGDKFSLYFTDLNGRIVYDSEGAVADWPKDVGVYKMVIEFLGDAANNYWIDDTVTIEIQPKNIAVFAENKTVTFGDVTDGIDYGWRIAAYTENNGVVSYPEGNPLVWGETKTEVANVVIEIKNAYNETVDFVRLDSKTIINLPAGNYSLVPSAELTETLTANYVIKSFVSATLTIDKMDIKVVAEDHVKTYGDGDMRFNYKVFAESTVGNFDRQIGGYYIGNEGIITLYRSLDGLNEVTDSILTYTLQRTQGEDVGFYDIIKGADAAISNYNLYDELGNTRYAGAELEIVKKPITIVGAQTEKHRKYGEKFTGELWRNEYVFALDSGSEMAWKQAFTAVFAELINYKDGYDAGKLIINVCDSGGTEISAVAPSVNASVGNYTIKISINPDYDGATPIASNYSVTVKDFNFEIVPMEAEIKIRSEFVEYSENPAWNRGTDYDDYSAVYEITYGENFDVENAVAPSVSFFKETGINVGRYEIILSDKSVTDNPNFILSCSGNFGTELKEYFDNDESLVGVAETVSALPSEQVNKAYVVVVPKKFAFEYAASEVYSKKLKRNGLVPEINFDFGRAAFSSATEQSVVSAMTFELTNKTFERSGEFFNADGYNGVLRYDYFGSDSARNFIVSSAVSAYVGNTAYISRSNYVNIYEYVIYGTELSSEIIFTQRFEYEILPVKLTVNVANVDFEYNGSVYSNGNTEVSGPDENGFSVQCNSRGIVLKYEAAKICAGDSLNVAYDFNVVYNLRTEAVKGEFVRESGAYTIDISDIGNYNYERNADTAAVCQFEVTPISLDIWLTNATEAKTETGETITEDGLPVMKISGIYTGREDTRLIDNVWVEENGYYVTQTQKIININSSVLTSAPRNLAIEAYYLDNGVAKAPVNAGDNYLFRWKINSEYVNYAVNFVKPKNDGYESCLYKYSITKKQVNILNFEESGINTKTYDGRPPEIKNTERLIIDGDVSTDRISIADLEFVFTRDMTKVPDSLVNIITDSSAGEFNVEVKYKDTYAKPQNYYFVLDAAYYTITRPTVQIVLNSVNNGGYSLGKQFDNLAPSVTQNELRISALTGTEITDDINVELEVAYYRRNSTEGWGRFSSTDYYPVGSYAYYFKPYFVVRDDSGNEIKVYGDDVKDVIFGLDDSKKILSWNYCYTLGSDAERNGCDGVYVISRKEVYISVPHSDYAVDALDGVEYYTHYHDYGNCDVTKADAFTALNDRSSVNAYSVVDSHGAVIGDNLGFVMCNLEIMAANETIRYGGEYFTVSAENLQSANSNFHIMNSNIRYAIGKLAVELKLTFLNTDGKTESVYGNPETVYSDPTTGDIGLRKVFEFVDKERFASALGLNAADISIKDWIGYTSDSYEEKFYINTDVAYYGLQNSSGEIARLSDLSSVKAGVYEAYISSITARNFELIIIPDVFTVQKKVINVNGARRDYFDKASLETDYSVDGDINADIREFVNAVLDAFFDDTAITADAGNYDTNENYYVRARKADIEGILALYANYDIVLNEVHPAVSQNAYYYIPLEISKIDLSVSMSNVELTYAQRLQRSDFNLIFDGFPSLSVSDSFFVAETEKQNIIREQIGNLINFDRISEFLSNRNATAETQIAQISSFLISAAEFTDYNVNFGEFTYFIEKIVLNFTIVNNSADTFSKNGNMSILAGEANSLVYSESDNGRLNYHIALSDTEKRKIVGYDANVHTDLQSIIELTFPNGQAPDDYSRYVNYSLRNKNGGTQLVAGDCIMKIDFSLLESINYVFQSNEMTVKYYPVVTSIGANAGANEIQFAAVSFTGEEANYVDMIKSGSMSMSVNINYNGMDSQIIDIINGISTTAYSDLKAHSAYWTVEFVDNEPSGIEVGNEIKLRLVFNESFFGGSENSDGKLFVIRSEEFLVRVYSTEDKVMATKSNSGFTYTLDGGQTYNNGGFGELKDVNATYYFSKVTDGVYYDYSDKFDHIYTEFVLNGKNSAEFTYEQILFDDGNNRLVLGFRGGSDYGYYAWIENSATGAVISDSVTAVDTYDVMNTDGEIVTYDVRNFFNANLFDGRRHKLSIYLDKLGKLYYNESESHENGDGSIVTVIPRKYKILFVLDDFYSGILEVEGGMRERLQKPDGTVEYSYLNNLDFSLAGKTGFRINECSAFIGCYTLKQVGINLFNLSDSALNLFNICDLRAWPVDNGSLIYAENLASVEKFVRSESIFDACEYEGRVDYMFSYTAVTVDNKDIKIDKENTLPGLYSVKLDIRVRNLYDVSRITVNTVNFYICVTNLSANGFTSFKAYYPSGEDTFAVYPDKPAVIKAQQSVDGTLSNVGMRIYSPEIRNGVNYLKADFDLADAPSVVKFILKSGTETVSVEDTTGISIDFTKTTQTDEAGKALYTASVVMSLNGTGTVWKQNLNGVSVALEGTDNVLETRFDYTNGTILVRLIRDNEVKFSCKVRRNFFKNQAVNEDTVRRVIGDPDLFESCYTGFFILGGTLTLKEYFAGDFVAGITNLSYIENGDVTGVGTPADMSSISGRNVLLTDMRGTAMATATKNTYFKFSALPYGDAVQDGANAVHSFNFMFCNNTPYFMATEVDSGTELSGERGSIIIFATNGIYVSFYKYKHLWRRWRISDANLLDGNTHTILLEIDTSAEYTYDEVKFYRFRMSLDGSIISGLDSEGAYGLRIPVSNNCNEILDRELTGYSDEEFVSDYSDVNDKMFVSDTRYVGIMPQNTLINVEELFVF